MMNITKRNERIESYTKLVSEWKASGMSQTKFAAAKGLSLSTLKYRIRIVRDLDFEDSSSSNYQDLEFVQIPGECISEQVFQDDFQMNEQPVLMFQTKGLSFQVANGISPHLLKTVLEVMSAC